MKRFENLEEPRKAGIIEAAALRFAEDGYAGTSLNQLLVETNLSKGSFYYYFHDKADLFATAVRRYLDLELFLDVDRVLSSDSADEFWEALRDSARKSVRLMSSRPLAIGLAQTFSELPQEMLSDGPIGEYSQAIWTSLAACVNRGRELGAVRADVPVEVLTSLWIDLDRRLTLWMLEEWQTANESRRGELATIALEMYQGMLADPRMDRKQAPLFTENEDE